MHVFEGTTKLPEYVALVDIEEDSSTDDGMNVRFHYFEDEVKV